MSSDKTLATAKHGGCVQLGDGRSLAEHITDHLCHHEYDIGGRAELLACVVEAIASDARDRFEAWARRNGYTLTRAADGEYCFISTRNLWNEWQAALSAQPSPGSQGDALHEAVGRIFGCDGSPWRTRDVAAVLRDYAALAARQPVGEPVDFYVCDACGHYYMENGVTCDCSHEAVQPPLRHIRMVAAPPAQAVDLGEMPEGWRLSKKATCYQLLHGNDIIGNLVGPDAEANAAIIARVLDSQAVGNG